MAHESLYGNWMGKSRLMGRKGPHKELPPVPSNDDDDYENAGMEEGTRRPPPKPPGPKGKAGVPRRKGQRAAAPASAPTLAPAPAPAQPPHDGPTATPTRPPRDGPRATPIRTRQDSVRCRSRHSLVMYTLLGICLLTCTAVLTFVLVNQPATRQELQAQVSPRPMNGSQEWEDWASVRADLEIAMAALQDALEALEHRVSEALATARQDREGTQQQIKAFQEMLDTVCQQCPRGWAWFQRTCYYFSTAVKTWPEAKVFCAEHGAHLVIINTEAEQDFVVETAAGKRGHWLGLSDQDTEAKWLWVDGTSLTLSFWSSGEPNNAGTENCVTMLPDGRWNDLHCYKTDYWICEMHWLC
ncbi:C-type lectin domain family 17, member A [Alligator sinensis]|uniref:C-type lectin domain family 17, member A n=1 Tax=Alligator sinensis TaxID=38654 RepID=A0A3Q0FMI0_ALLSI|nr:C-type lectin domain family 17, member A [Alligator sinensis]